MGCTSSLEIKTPEKKLPLFYTIKRDSQLNNLFQKLLNNLKKLNKTQDSLNIVHFQLKSLLGINNTQHDTNHLIKTLITTITVLNQGQILQKSDFKISEKFPFFSGKKTETVYGLEVSAFLGFYRTYINCALENQGLIQIIQKNYECINNHLALIDQKNIYDEEMIYNITQLKYNQEKVNNFNHIVIQQILFEHQHFVQNFQKICLEATSTSQVFYQNHKNSIKEISNSLLTSANTQTSI